MSKNVVTFFSVVLKVVSSSERRISHTSRLEHPDLESKSPTSCKLLTMLCCASSIEVMIEDRNPGLFVSGSSKSLYPSVRDLGALRCLRCELLRAKEEGIWLARPFFSCRVEEVSERELARPRATIAISAPPARTPVSPAFEILNSRSDVLLVSLFMNGCGKRLLEVGAGIRS